MIRVAAFPRRGYPYTVCFYEALQKKGIEVLEGDSSIRWLTREVKNIDYFHFHWPSFAYAYRDNLKKTFHELVRYLLYLTIIKISGKKILWTAHNLYPHDKGRQVSIAIDIFVRHLITKITSIIFVHGLVAAKIVVGEFPRTRKKLVIINHGHWVNFYKNQASKELARQKLEVPADKFVFLFVGTCKRYKNIPALVKAFKQLSENVMLLIAGRFQEECYFKEITDSVQENEDRIRLVGQYIPDDDLQFYLNASDAVVLPYSEILTSGAAMLAISMGKPVIAPEKGYLKDVINSDCGLLYKPEDPNGLLNALREIQEKSFDEGIIIKHALAYDWDSIADRVCKELVENHNELKRHLVD